MPKKKNILIAAIILIAVIAASAVIWGGKKVLDKSPKKTYDVAVMARSQNSSNPEEDAKTSLKYGDVLLHKDENWRWSNTELVSYLIIKMSLTDDQAQKLMAPKERELSKDEIRKEMDSFKEGRADITEEELDRYEEELIQRRETLVMRAYRIDMEKEFPDFKPNDLLSGQPYQKEVYGWGIVSEK